MSYIVILMSFTAIFPSIGYGVLHSKKRRDQQNAAWDATISGKKNTQDLSLNKLWGGKTVSFKDDRNIVKDFK
jgi:hypothetical protein